MLKPINQLCWADRFGILAGMDNQPSDADICRVFGVDYEALTTARDMLNQGVLRTNPRINSAFYSLFFTSDKQPEFPAAEKRIRTLPMPADAEERRLFASQNKNVKPRGRKSNNIDLAFKAIPTNPVDVEKFAEKHRCSVAVLRQHKRFDKYPGTVFVRKNKETGITEVWREPATEA